MPLWNVFMRLTSSKHKFPMKDLGCCRLRFDHNSTSSRFFCSFSTADICDNQGLDVSKMPSSTKVKIIDSALSFKNFGGRSEFQGRVVTIKAYESNPLVRATLQEAGNGRVLVVDAGGSTRCAMLGDNLAQLGVDNGWAGIVIYGCIRDSKLISTLDIGVKALNTHPVKSHKGEPGLRDVPLSFGGVTICPGNILYSDPDGILVTTEEV